MKKVLFLLVAMGLFAGLFVSCNNAPAATELKVGFIGPLSGDYAKYGVTMSQAAQMAIDERNAAKQFGDVKITLVKEDSEGKPEKATAAFEKLASVDKISGLIGEVFSGASLAISPKAEAEKLVMISASASSADLTKGKKFTFRTTPSDGLQADVFGRYVAADLGIKTVATLYTKNDYSQALAASFKAVYETAGGKVVAEESGSEGDKDFKTQLTKIKAANPEALYLPNYVAEIAQILEQAASLGLKVKILSADGFSNPEILTLAGKYAEGVIFSGAPVAQASEKATAFADAYKKAFNMDADDFAKNAYDATNILLDGLKAAYDKADDNGKKSLALDRDAVQASVAATKDFDGVSGKVTFDGGDVVKNIAINKVEGGKFVAIGDYKVEAGALAKVQ
jgi:branched-chain amino acid transport system substrate-binding protein